MIRTPIALRLAYWPDPILRGIIREVNEPFDSRYTEMINDMKKTMASYGGVGLAAPQVGFIVRFCLVKVHQDVYPMFNPKIISRSGTQINDERCLSLPGTVFKDIIRDERIEVGWLGVDGTRMFQRLDGPEAVEVQHEIDHLDGKLLIDRWDKKRQDKMLQRIQIASLAQEDKIHGVEDKAIEPRF